jgi:hypothetical protein
MKNATMLTIMVLVLGLVVCTTEVSEAAPMGTAFTYQGRLMDANNPADGLYDFQFHLYTSFNSLSPLAGPIDVNDVDVTDGSFTVDLDFGSNAFTGDARWLEIGVRPGETSDAFTPLGPRQEVTPTPYALYAKSSGGDNDWMVSEDDMYSIPAGNVGIGTTNPDPDYKLHINEVDPSNNLLVAIDNNFRHSGLLLDCATNYDTSVLFRENGTNKFMIQNDGTTDYGLGIYEYGQGFTTVWKSGKVGIGTTSPEHKLSVSTSETTGRAIYGEASASPGSGVTNYGGYFVARGGRGKGVYGEASNTGDFINEGGRFAATGRYGRGVYGNSTGTDGRGVYGLASASSGTNYGVYGETYSNTGYAGYFNGRVRVTGYLYKDGGGFQIDHPLEPENKYLYHSFVESPDMMNVYNGNVVLDKSGEAVVKLPEYFEALNQDFRYQLTCIGGFAPVYVSEEISENRFKIAGGKREMKVSWQVTGIRNDPYAQANRIAVEEDKAVEARGYYLHPKLYGHGEEKGIEVMRNARVSKTRQVAKTGGKL